MTAIFVDTNIFVYAATPLSVTDTVKVQIARRILLDDDLALSTQVLQEFYWAATRPHKLALSHDEAVAWIEMFKRFPVQPVTLGVVEDALYLCARYQLSYWDAAIIAAARHMNCSGIYSEDRNDGQHFEGIVVRNPFLVPDSAT